MWQIGENYYWLKTTEECVGGAGTCTVPHPTPVKPLVQASHCHTWHTWSHAHAQPLVPQSSPRVARWVDGPPGQKVAGADKTHCPDMHALKSHLSLHFMAAESMLGSKVLAVSCFPLFVSLYLFSAHNFLFLKYGSFKVGWVEFVKSMLGEMFHFDYLF